MVRKFNKILAGVLAVFLLMQCYLPVFAMNFQEYNVWEKDKIQEQEYGDSYSEELCTIGDATRLDASSDSLEFDSVSVRSSRQLDPSESLYESSLTMMALSGSEQTSIVRYMDSNMVGAPYNYTGGYTNSKSQGWCCAGAVSKVLYYAYDCRDIVNTCENSSWVPSIRKSLDATASFEKVYDVPLCFRGLSADEVNTLFSQVTQAGDIIIFYGPEGNTQPHCGIAGGGNVLYSALVHTGFSPTTIAYYVCSGTRDPKAAGGMAVFRKKPVLGRIRFCKTSTEESVTGKNPIYSMKGAIYAVSTSKEVDENGFLKYQIASMMIEDDTDNISNNANVEPGYYYIQEIKGPDSNTYMLDKKVYGPFLVNENQRTTVGIPSVDNLEKLQPGTYIKNPIWEIPVVYNKGLNIVKKDAENIGTIDDKAWEDVEFAVRYYNAFYDLESVKEQVPSRTWILKTKKDKTGNYCCKLQKEYLQPGSDELYQMGDEEGILPYGTLTIEETKAPVGYRLEDMRFFSEATGSYQDNFFITQIKNDNKEIALEAGNTVIAYDYKIRGDLEFYKVNQEDKKPMAGIPFAIISKSTGETHVVVTDNEGHCSTAASHMSHLYQTNNNDYLYDVGIETDKFGTMSDVVEAIDVSQDEIQEGDRTENESTALQASGIWFFGEKRQGEISGITDKRGALPYDTYIVQELSCKANEGFQLLEPFEVKIDKEAVVADAKTLTNVPTPVIGTNAWEKTWKSHYACSIGEPISLIDTVHYKWLKAGGCYTIKGCLVDLQTKEVVRDKEGNYVQKIERLFVDDSYECNPYEKCGDFDMEYSVEMDDLEGKDLIFFEYLFEGENTSDLVDEKGVIHLQGAIAKHEDYTAEEQMVHFAGIKTEAFWGGADDKMLTIKGENDQKIITRDVVNYRNLNLDKTYKLEAQLMYYDDAIGKEIPLVDSEGNAITAYKVVVPEQADGQITVAFPELSVKTFLGKDDTLMMDRIVVYERLYCEDRLIVEECSMDNENQTLLLEKMDIPESKVMDQKKEVYQYPHETGSPQTGDAIKLKLLMTVMLVCIGGIVGVLVLKRR